MTYTTPPNTGVAGPSSCRENFVETGLIRSWQGAWSATAKKLSEILLASPNPETPVKKGDPKKRDPIVETLNPKP